ncbi:MAG: oxidoreductase [Bacilli bacterium]|nr:oxidoreductase [Bacilli bacterium]
MERIRLSETLELSRIIQGLMRLTSWSFSKVELLHHLESLIDLGVTSFDIADIYGDYTCEELLGESLNLNPSLRSEIQIITKCGIKITSDKYPERKIKHYDTSKEHIITTVNNSLRKLGTDYLDLLLIHRPDPFMDPEEVSEAFNILYKSGKVLNFGVSNFKPSSFNLLQKYSRFSLVTNQIEISPLNLRAFRDGTIELCQEYEIPPMAYSPLAGGRLFNTSSEEAINVCQKLEEIAMSRGLSNLDTVVYAFLLSHPAKILPVVGTRSIERVKHAILALDYKLSREEWFEIYTAGLGKSVD